MKPQMPNVTEQLNMQTGLAGTFGLAYVESL